MNDIPEAAILRFMREKKPELIVKAPARINLINPLDAVEADYWAPAMAITGARNPLASYCYVKSYPYTAEQSKCVVFTSPADDPEDIQVEQVIEFHLNDLVHPANLDPALKKDIFLGSLSYLFQKIPEFKKVLLEQAVEVGVFTSIPRQSGVGGSSALIISVLWAMGCYCRFERRDPQSFSNYPFNRDVIGELSTEIENYVLENTAGYGDRYTIARGGIGFTSYVGKLHHPKMGEGPLAVYDRIDLTYSIDRIPIVLGYSGIAHTSGNVHAVLREKYLAGDEKLHALYDQLAEIAWKARYSFMKHDWKQLGKFFSENARISEEIMVHSGFKYGIGIGNRILIDAIKDDPRVHAVKLSGAGGGGSVFALVQRDAQEFVAKKWRQELLKRLQDPDDIRRRFPDITDAELDRLQYAKFFHIHLNRHGVHEVACSPRT